jgi:hypothetical protein
VDGPRRGLDPLALAVNGVAVVAMLAVGGYLAVSLWRYQPPPPLPKPVVVAKKPAPAAKQAPVAKPAAEPRPVATGEPVPSQLITQHGAGRHWMYRVDVQPPLWRNATLRYRIDERGGEKAVATHFLYAGGEMNFSLGVLAANHPSHAQTRFPGFFLYAAYLDQPLEIGRRFTWQWPWQLPNGQVRAGRVKRYDAVVMEWGNLAAPPSVKAPNDMFAVVRIDAILSYVEDGVVRATAVERFWYAPRYMQIVRIVREGKTPDEAVHQIVAELVEHTYP